MSTQDILNIVLTLGVLIITGCIVVATVVFITALKAVIRLAETVNETTHNIKEKMQMKALSALPGLLFALIGKVISKRRG